MPENTSVFESSIKKVKETVLETFSDEDVCVVLFGSRARGDSDLTSDIDIGIFPRGVTTKDKIFLLREKLENMNIPYNVDMVDLSKVSDSFRKKALREGQIWKN